MVGWGGLAVARDIKHAADKDLAAARFGIKNSLSILGIGVPDKM